MTLSDFVDDVVFGPYFRMVFAAGCGVGAACGTVVTGLVWWLT